MKTLFVALSLISSLVAAQPLTPVGNGGSAYFDTISVGTNNAASSTAINMGTNDFICWSGSCFQYSSGASLWNFQGTVAYGNSTSCSLSSTGIGCSSQSWSSMVYNTQDAPDGTAHVGLIAAENDAAGVVARIGSTDAAPAAGAKLAQFCNGASVSACTEVASITTDGSIRTAFGPGTAGSGTGITANDTGFVGHRVHKVTIDETALSAAATTEDETAWTIPAKTRLLRISGHVTVAFAGTAITDVKIMCGTSGGSNVYLISQDVDVLNAALGDVAADIGASLTAATVADIPSVTATQAIVCRFTCTGANCVAMTAGSVSLFIEHIVYP